MSWPTLLAIGSGGFIGAVMRAWVSGLANRHIPHDLPIGTLTVNMLGSFIMGLIFAWFSTQPGIPQHIKSFISTGFLGAFTTYSTFAIETFILLNGKTWAWALSNMALNVFGTILAAAAGYKIYLMLFKNIT